MTAETILAGASFHNPIDWHAIDWKQVHRNVRRMQVRMVSNTCIRGNYRKGDGVRSKPCSIS